MHSSTILTLFLCCLFLMVKASPLPEPLPEAIPGDDQVLACQPPPDHIGNQHPQEEGGDEKPEDKQRKKQQEEEEKRLKKEKEREHKEKEREQREKEREQREKEREHRDAERAKADEERARKESNQTPPPPSGNNHGGGGGGGSSAGGVRGNTGQSPPPPKPEGLPKQGGGNYNGGGNQGGGAGGGQGGGEQKPPPPQKPPPETKSPPPPPPPASLPVGGKTFTGPATFYGGNLQGGNCMMAGYQLPSGVYGAAIGGDNWDGSGNCGACAKVNGPGGKSVTIMFVDKCPECAQGLDLFPDAFKQLNDPSVGRFTVTWEFVTCPVQGPIKIKDKEGTNEYYVAMQVQNGKEATKSLEISSDGGKTFKMCQRDDSNHFVFNGQVGAQIVDVRVTSKSGKTVVVPGVPVSSAQKDASQNYD